MNQLRPAGFLFWLCICLAGSTWIPRALAGPTPAPAEVSSILESGGFMMVSKMEGTLPTVIWDAGVAEKPLNTFQEFQEYIRTKGQFADVSSFRP